MLTPNRSRLRWACCELISSDAAGDYPYITKPGGHISKIGGRSAKLFSSGQHIPEYFTQTDNDVLFRSHSFPHSARSEMSIDFARNLITNSVWRSGTQLDVYRSRNAPLLRTEPGGGGIRGYKHLTP